MTEFVVPKSIPTAFGIVVSLLVSARDTPRPRHRAARSAIAGSHPGDVRAPRDRVVLDEFLDRPGAGRRRRGLRGHGMRGERHHHILETRNEGGIAMAMVRRDSLGFDLPDLWRRFV